MLTFLYYIFNLRVIILSPLKLQLLHFMKGIIKVFKLNYVGFDNVFIYNVLKAIDY